MVRRRFFRKLQFSENALERRDSQPLHVSPYDKTTKREAGQTLAVCPFYEQLVNRIRATCGNPARETDLPSAFAWTADVRAQ